MTFANTTSRKATLDRRGRMLILACVGTMLIICTALTSGEPTYVPTQVHGCPSKVVQVELRLDSLRRASYWRAQIERDAHAGNVALENGVQRRAAQLADWSDRARVRRLVAANADSAIGCTR